MGCSTLLGALAVAAAALLLGLRDGQPAAQVSPDDGAFAYEGRWVRLSEHARRSDWSCTGVRFRVQVASAGASLFVHWSGVRTRLKVSVRDSGRNTSWNRTIRSYWIGTWGGLAEKLVFPAPGNYTVQLRKLTSPAPYGTGLASHLLAGSVLEFHGLGGIEGKVMIQRPRQKSRKIEFIGSSDTAGFCCDGNPHSFGAHAVAMGWMLENCGNAYPGLLGEMLGAEISVQALSGLGLVQNAYYHTRQSLLGPLPMPAYWPRMLQTDAASETMQFEKPFPNLVVVDLGGNDFNHQEGQVPADFLFTAAFTKLLDTIFKAYGGLGTGLKVAAVCGMGDPTEASRDSDNDRCRPCPQIKKAVESFRSRIGMESNDVAFFDVPCDGSVVTGSADHLGCLSHKGLEGHLGVAKFLEPKLRSFMGWR